MNCNLIKDVVFRVCVRDKIQVLAWNTMRSKRGGVYCLVVYRNCSPIFGVINSDICFRLLFILREKAFYKDFGSAARAGTSCGPAGLCN